ncbi:MerR family transcriptional regulator [Aquaticitalea lipolytica]|uniref:MerR family transcriptional regulator n=1 Tax=Aquaticitalea lipolytica TaxID=1247562 RepID=A0A8J2XHG6_9FLAO|nr:MerR family transcriptional regulator [Aquaticitalea lipolytica]GFZ88535.1 MerR family transcriptional regulator [Aquaticitalea lipolytica]
MNNIQTTFSIKDLENLSGIKAHTIRIWEKRYNLLEPERTETNIRYYNLASLQKLLNVSFLNNNGYKISKIAKLKRESIPLLVKEISEKSDSKENSINAFKLSMLNFDQALFYNTYESLAKEKSFKDIFYNIFIPLLSEIGVLWQTDSITPAHEHFITTLIRQKILVNTELLQAKNINKTSKTFVLYLPDNEIHELGLMFINYEIIAKGYHSIFLGQSVPLNNLTDLLSFYQDITFISYFTVKPDKEDILHYLVELNEKVLKNSGSQCWILGKQLEEFDFKTLPKQITPFSTIESLVKKL